MAKIDWTKPENRDRLLAAAIAALNPKLRHSDHVEIAECFGKGATASAIEHEYRRVRKAAKKLIVERDQAKADAEAAAAEEGGEPGAASETLDVSPAKEAKKSRASKKKDGVIEGRVTKKSLTKTPAVKAAKKSLVKAEREVDDEMDKLSGMKKEEDDSEALMKDANTEENA